MKENKYDNPVFFEKYSQMDRSQKGLAGAGEWETLRDMMPDFHGKRVLDLGCGYGWHCIYAMEQGALSVTGVDISQKMLETAREKTAYPEVTYLQMPIEDISFPPESFEIAISSLALHYVEDYESVVRKVRDLLTPGGTFLFSAEHPVFTAQGAQDWYYGPDGEKLHFPVDNYFYEGRRTAHFLGEEVTKFHRTLTTYLGCLLGNGFAITRLAEPQPPKGMLEGSAEMRDELRRPMMLIVSARKI